MAEKHPFDWQKYPAAEAWLLSLCDKGASASPFLKHLQRQMLEIASSRLLDWVDHLIITETEAASQDLSAMGFVEGEGRVWHHPGAQLPRFVVVASNQPPGLALLVDRITDFLMAQRLDKEIEGTPFSGYRRCRVAAEKNFEVYAVERRGTLTLQPTEEDEQSTGFFFRAYEAWASRPRRHGYEDEDMAFALDLARDLARNLGPHRAAAIVLEVERRYWEIRNTAGQVQKSRQDRLGLGWANHDHHTFRSSRKQFHLLVQLFEILGFHCRERFYAGKEAGWGAQVMENPEGRFVLFLDVDLVPSELEIDFAHEQLPPVDHLNTVGLWCALHGDSILRAGMHHLECQFMFEELTQDLKHFGVRMMTPFSDFPYLKQAFSQGERWLVDPEQLEKLAAKKWISPEEKDRFLNEGAIGSHMENLQRREGYKGFNQNNVSLIITATDPRK